MYNIEVWLGQIFCIFQERIMYNLEEFESVIGGIAFTNLIIKY